MDAAGTFDICVIDDALKPTDELAHRWATQANDWDGRKTSSTFRAMKAAAGILLEPGFPPQMDDDVAALAKILSECKASREDSWVYTICFIHYCTGGSSAQKANRLGTARTKFYEVLKLALSYLRGRIKAAGVKV